MSTQIVTVQLDLSTAAILQTLEEKAVAQGLPLSTLLQSLAETAETDESSVFFERTPEERAKAFEAWVKTHRLTAPPLSDEAISRESIYSEREDRQL